jgi:hypothetical protein
MMQSAGTPPAPTGFSASADGPGATKDLAAITLTWNTTSPNGPPLKNYTVKRRVNGGAWAQLKTVPAGTTRTSDQVVYDGRRYEYVVTATNGADLTSPDSAVQSFTSIGMPSTPSVSAATPTEDKRARLTVDLGQPRASGFTSVSWRSSDGESGTYSCGTCPANGKVTFTTSVLGTTQKTFTVRTNNGTRESQQSGNSNQVQPYGPTPRPNPNGSSASGKTVTFNWTLPTDGRPITGVKISGDRSYNGQDIRSISVTVANYSQDVTINIVAVSAAGDSPALTMTRRTDDPPQPQVTNVRQGPMYTDPNGVGTCRVAPGCPQVRFDYADFTTGAARYECQSQGAGNVGPYNWNVPSSSGTVTAWCIFGRGVGPVRIVVWKDGKTIASAWYPWPNY